MQKLVVLDAGGQYCHLIARRLRQIGVYADVKPSSSTLDSLHDYSGVIISGGPSSVYDTNRPDVDQRIFDLGVPVMGICYGHQIMAHHLGGTVVKGTTAEYGVADMRVTTKDSLFRNLPSKQKVWMSHRDLVTQVPDGFELLASTDACPVAAMGNHSKRFYGVQFHPEVANTPSGMDMLRSFVKTICACDTSAWKPSEQVSTLVNDIRKQVGTRSVLFFISGGVDSSVALSLCVKALGHDKVEGVFVDTGCMRDIDVEDIVLLRKSQKAKIRIVDAREEFISLISHVYSPEKKRQLIGQRFVEVHERVLSEYFEDNRADWMLGQGTIYPDTIESGGTQHASTIKTHHNRISTILKMLEEGKVIEPLNQFYKDEVREIGRALRIDERLINKQPFPGPGLAIRCITSTRSHTPVQDSNVSRYASKEGFQGVKIALKTVGVKGDERSYQGIAVIAGDGNHAGLEAVSTNITNSCVDVTRVLYSINRNPFVVDDWCVKNKRVTSKRVELLRRADSLVRDLMIRDYPLLWSKIWQFPVILIPLFNTRTDRESIVLRPVDSIDGMTASFSRLSPEVLHRIADELRQDLQVETFFDVTNKPPATIEWE